jgi:hypothetical protein
MKKTALSLACISSIILLSTTPVHAAEKKTIFTTESIKYESGTGSERCQDKCGRRSGPDVKSLVSGGWKIIGSSPKEVVGERYWYVPCNTCKPHGCVCIGTEYILEKAEPEQRIETKSNAVEPPAREIRTVDIPPSKENQGVVISPKVETPKNEPDFLRKENELLKQENALLRQENETLRNQIRSFQK